MQFLTVCPMGERSCFYDMALALGHPIVDAKEAPDGLDPATHTLFLFGLNVPDWYTRLESQHYTYVAMQFEQCTSDWFTGLYLTRLEQAYMIYEYSPRNRFELSHRFPGLAGRMLYKPCAVRVIGELQSPPPERDIDVLFYGSNGYRRVLLMNHLITSRPHWNIVWDRQNNNLWGTERNRMVQRAKVVLNLHYYEVAILESPRILGALCVGAVVLSERSVDEQMDDEFAPYVVFVEMDELVQRCEYFIKRPAECETIRERGRAWALQKNYD